MENITIIGRVKSAEIIAANPEKNLEKPLLAVTVVHDVYKDSKKEAVYVDFTTEVFSEKFVAKLVPGADIAVAGKLKEKQREGGNASAFLNRSSIGKGLIADQGGKISLVVGNLGADAVERTRKATADKPEGKFLSFSVAASRYTKDESGAGTDETVWVDCTKNFYAEGLVPLLKKGTKLAMIGQLSVVDGKTKFVADKLEFFGNKKESAAPVEAPANASTEKDI